MALNFITRVHAQRVLSNLAHVYLSDPDSFVQHAPRLTLALLQAMQAAEDHNEVLRSSASWRSDTSDAIRALELELAALPVVEVR